ncbi:MAG: efflux RND transporter permease subunit [Bacteroidia bacterium]|nr:efflux RND transporter permease subunit [Bacteroidia bacterium]
MNNEKEKTKEFGLSTWAINNRKSVYLIIFILTIGGLGSYISMPKESFPEINIPTIYVGTAYPGVSPKVIESKITKPLEKEINTIKGVNKLTSTSVLGYSTVIVEFDFSVTTTEGLRKVKDKVDLVKGQAEFPKDLPVPPNVFEINFSEFPIMNINLSGNYSSEELRKFAEFLKDEVKKIEEIDRAEIRGIPEKELKIEVDRFKAESRNISFYDIQTAVQSQNITTTGGEILIDDLRKTIRIDGEFKTPEEIGDIIVKDEKFNAVYLRDIADVKFEEKEAESFAREFEKPVVMIDVIKRPGKNLLSASDKILTMLEKTKKDFLPSDLNITVTNDQSTQIRDQVSNLENNILFGIILVVGVLLFFLGLRNALFVGIAIPLSMFMSFLILDYLGVTLNIMVLFSLVMALGMLVDNGIVLVENVYRLMSEGKSRIQAAKQGIGEIAWPIIASTATTLAAFVPLAMWPGIMGEFMKYLPITLIVVLSSSLFVALVINAAITSVYMKLEEKEINKKRATIISIVMMLLGFVLILANTILLGMFLFVGGLLFMLNTHVFNKATKTFQNKFLPKLENKYYAFLSFALRGKNPVKLFFATLGMLFFSFVLIGIFTPKVEFFPINEPNYINIFIQKPIGTDINVTNKLTKEVEKMVINHLNKYNDTITENGITRINNFMVQSVVAQVGKGTSDPNEGPSMAATPNKARITVNFVESIDRRGINTADIMNDVRALLGNKFTADVQITVDKNPAGPPQEPPVNIEVTSDVTVDYDVLIEQAEKLKNFVEKKNIAGIEQLRINIETGKPEIPIIINKEKAKMLGISTQQIAMNIRTALFGNEISKFKEDDDDYQINVRYADNYRYDLNTLLNQKITFRDQMTGKIRQVPISALIDEPKTMSTYSSIKRKKEKRIVTVVSNVIEGANANEVVANIKTELVDFKLDKGFNYDFTGQQEQQAKEMSFLSKALLVAVFLIFLIMVLQFNSLSSPFIIMVAVLFSLIGVFLGLVIFQMDFIIIMTMIGIISLAGVIVNNAIVLIDYTNLVMENKKKEIGLDENERLSIEDVIDSIKFAGKTRLRPVLLTAITTILGLLPMAIGLNIDFISFFTTLDPKIYFGGDNAIFFGPMSYTIIFGLTFATFLTLIIIPVMYLMLIKFKYRVIKLENN